MEKSTLNEIFLIIVLTAIILLIVIYVLWCIYTVICAMRDQDAFFGLIKFNDRKAVKNPVNVSYDSNDIISRTALFPAQIILLSKGPTPESGNRYFFKYDYTIFYGENFQQQINKDKIIYLTGSTYTGESRVIYFEDNIVYGTRHSIGIPLPLFDYLKDEDSPLQISVTRTIYYSNVNPTGVTSLTPVISPVIENMVNIVSTVLLKDHENVTSNYLLFEEVI